VIARVAHHGSAGTHEAILDNQYCRHSIEASPLDWNWTTPPLLSNAPLLALPTIVVALLTEALPICKRLLLTQAPVELRVWFVARDCATANIYDLRADIAPATAAIMPRLVMVPPLSVPVFRSKDVAAGAHW